MIKDLPSKFKVLSHNFVNKKNEVKLARKEIDGIRECYKITFENGTFIIATKEHKFFDMNGNVIQVKDLVKGDDLYAE